MLATLFMKSFFFLIQKFLFNDLNHALLLYNDSFLHSANWNHRQGDDLIHIYIYISSVCFFFVFSFQENRL